MYKFLLAQVDLITATQVTKTTDIEESLNSLMMVGQKFAKPARNVGDSFGPNRLMSLVTNYLKWTQEKTRDLYDLASTLGLTLLWHISLLLNFRKRPKDYSIHDFFRQNIVF